MKTVRTNLLVVLVLLCAFMHAQIEATTKDGKKVILNKNGTWKYAKVTASASPQAKPLNQVLKKEAMEFSMQLVRSYFIKDCSVLQIALAPEVFTVKQQYSITNELKAKLCESIVTAITDSTKTFNDYLANYKIELVSKAELEAKFKMSLPAHYNSTAEEFYFLGFEKMPGSKVASFISARLFALLIRKTADKWEVKGFLED